MYRIYLGPQVLTILLGWHESVRTFALVNPSYPLITIF